MDTRCSLFLTLQFSLLFFGLASSPSISCHEPERSALLEFKKSFFNRAPDSCYDYQAYKKIDSWKMDGELKNCCAWDGIECDANSGHVIAVELSDNCLTGTISSKTTLFHLVHLQRLELSENGLIGQVPPEILRLTNLLSLDLSFNKDKLKLKKPTLQDLVRNLTKLENLSLSEVNIPAPLPDMLANLSSLRSLELEGCDLKGEFPPSIFKLPKLEILEVRYNEQLSGQLPEFDWRSPLKSLTISFTCFSGELPSSLGNLASLNELALGFNSFTNQIPSSFVNLTQLKKLYIYFQQMREIPFWIKNLTQLSELILSNNVLTSEIPTWIGQLSNLEVLDLSSNKLTGEIPSSLFNLTRLTLLDLGSNQFSGRILPQLTKLPHLSEVNPGFNKFTGSIPSSIVENKDLVFLILDLNNFNETVRMSLFFELKSPEVLVLSFNKLSLIDDLNNTSAYHAKFSHLGLASCNLSRLPTFLQHQDRLIWLDLSNNRLSGEIPKWLLERDISMENLNLSSNLLTSSAHTPLSFRWKSLDVLDLRHNNLKGSLPIPPASTKYHLISRNKLSGNIPSQMCQLSKLEGLDLSENNLTGVLPQCLKYLSHNLTFLSLHHNNFIGPVSSILGTGKCNLRMLDVSGNQFNGSIPRSLARCQDLEFLNFGSNQIKDIFPSWLGSLRNLRALSYIPTNSMEQ